LYQKKKRRRRRKRKKEENGQVSKIVKKRRKEKEKSIQPGFSQYFQVPKERLFQGAKLIYDSTLPPYS
jgi:hypothetical protein